MKAFCARPPSGVGVVAAGKSEAILSTPAAHLERFEPASIGSFYSKSSFSYVGLLLHICMRLSLLSKLRVASVMRFATNPSRGPSACLVSRTECLENLRGIILPISYFHDRGHVMSATADTTLVPRTNFCQWRSLVLSSRSEKSSDRSDGKY